VPGRLKEEGAGGRAGGQARGTTPRQLQNSPSFIVESHDSESPYPRLLPFATRPPPPPPRPLPRLPCRPSSVFVYPSASARSPPSCPPPTSPSSLSFFRSLLLRLSYLFLYRRSFPGGAAAVAVSTPPAGISPAVTPCAYYAYTSALDGTERGD